MSKGDIYAVLSFLSGVECSDDKKYGKPMTGILFDNKATTDQVYVTTDEDQSLSIAQWREFEIPLHKIRLLREFWEKHECTISFKEYEWHSIKQASVNHDAPTEKRERKHVLPPVVNTPNHGDTQQVLYFIKTARILDKDNKDIFSEVVDILREHRANTDQVFITSKGSIPQSITNLKIEMLKYHTRYGYRDIFESDDCTIDFNGYQWKSYKDTRPIPREYDPRNLYIMHTPYDNMTYTSSDIHNTLNTLQTRLSTLMQQMQSRTQAHCLK
jgi:hypothetical protein